ncbi:MAG: hypothetical protein V4502_12180, partial [Pseudomonadota bacterium]
WRAMLGIAFLLITLAIPAVNLLVSPADFRARWLEWSSAGFVVAWLWFAWVAWPAFRFLANGPETVRVEGGDLVFSTGERHKLTELSAVEILRPWLRHPQVALQFGREWVTIETAFQKLGERKCADDIANTLAQAARP